MRTGLSIAAGLCLAGAATAPAAQASQASFSGGTVTVTASPGERNAVAVDSYAEIEDRAGITAGPGCAAISPTKVQCAPVDEGEYEGITYGHYDAVQVALGDGDDTLDITRLTLERATVDAGDGDDRVRVHNLSATVDAGAGDDTVWGTTGDDTLAGGPGADTVEGDSGNDTVDGGAGRDILLGDSDLRGNGNDRLLSRDGEQDQVSCNLGSDTVTADAADVVEEPSCELVDRGAAADPPAAPGVTPPTPGGARPKQCAAAKNRRVCLRRAKAIARCKAMKTRTAKARRRKAACLRKARRIGKPRRARAVAATAQASTASLVNGVLTVTAAPGVANDLFVYNSYGDEYVEDKAGVTPGPGCAEYQPPTLVVCAGAATSAVTVQPGDGDDQVDVGFQLYLEGLTTVHGGPGNDRIDGVFDTGAVIDGGDGDDTLAGGDGADTLTGGPGRDTVEGDGGNDRIDGGPGQDILTGDSSARVGSDGNDTIMARDGEQDQVDCGLGSDLVTADATDVVENLLCESVDRPAAGGATEPGTTPLPATAKPPARCAKLRGAKRSACKRAKAIARCKAMKTRTAKAKRKQAACLREARRIGKPKRARK